MPHGIVAADQANPDRCNLWLYYRNHIEKEGTAGSTAFNAAASRSWSQCSCILYLHHLFVQAIRLQPESQLHPLSPEATFHHDGLKRILVDVSHFFDATWTGLCYDGDVTRFSTPYRTIR